MTWLPFLLSFSYFRVWDRNSFTNHWEIHDSFQPKRTMPCWSIPWSFWWRPLLVLRGRKDKLHWNPIFHEIQDYWGKNSTPAQIQYQGHYLENTTIWSVDKYPLCKGKWFDEAGYINYCCFCGNSAEILARPLHNFHWYDLCDVYATSEGLWENFWHLRYKLTSIFYASVLLLIMNFVIALSKESTDPLATSSMLCQNSWPIIGQAIVNSAEP